MLFSVIVPVFNVEKYLKECITNILNQTYDNYEIIMVNDGSTDNSPYICDNIKQQNACVRVIHKENGGLSDARNVGLKCAKGKYVVFLDSDDYWDDNEFLKKIEKIIENKDPDLITFGYKKVDANGVLRNYIPKKDCSNIKELVLKGYFNISAWDKVIKRAILVDHNIEFKKGVFSEDMQWCGKLYAATNTCATLCEAPHAYRQHIGSITKCISQKNIEDVMANYQSCLDIKSEMNGEKSRIYKYFLSKNLSMFMIAISQLNHDEQKKYYPIICSNIDILKYNTRKREKYIYYTVKIIGLKNVERLLKILYVKRQRINK